MQSDRPLQHDSSSEPSSTTFDPTRRVLLGAAFVWTLAAHRTGVAASAPRSFPPSVSLTPNGPRLVRTGTGRFRFFFVPYYDCALYVLPELKDPAAVVAADAPRRLIIDAVRQITAFEFLWGLDQGLADNSSRTELKALAADLERVRAIVREAGGLERGERGCLDYLPGIGIRLLVDDVPQGPALGGKALADALFKVWLGERPLDASLKESLFAG